VIENIPRSLLGLAFDQKFGLLVYAPIYAVVAWGFGPLCAMSDGALPR
jgi:hypothetical protein